MSWDAVIAGAGPAGLAAALELSAVGWKVLLVERSRFPREKVCGGFIGPENKVFLERHELLSALEQAGAQHVEEVWMSSAGGAEFRIPVTLNGRADTALGLSRKEFDRILMERAISQGVCVKTETLFQRDAADQKRFKLKPIQGGNEEIVTAHYFIDATGGGAHGQPRRDCGYLGMAASFTRPREADRSVMLHFIQGGHLGMNTFEENKRNVCYLATQQLVDQVRGDKEALFQLFMEQNPAVSRILKGQERLSEWKGVRFELPRRRHFFEDGLFYAGDSVSAIHPVVGGGITLAIAGGVLLSRILSQAARQGLSSTQAAQTYQREWEKFFGLRLWVASALGRMGHQAVLANGAMQLLAAHQSWAQRAFGFQHHLDKKVFAYA